MVVGTIFAVYTLVFLVNHPIILSFIGVSIFIAFMYIGMLYDCKAEIKRKTEGKKREE